MSHRPTPDLPELPPGAREAVEAVWEGVARDDAVGFAYLFGSMAKGRVRGASDLDLAVHLPGAWGRERRLDHALDLEAALERGAGRQVQVTVLNDAPLELRFNVLAHGVLLHVRDDAARRSFFVDTGRHYYDMAPAREIFRRYQGRRIREGSFGG